MIKAIIVFIKINLKLFQLFRFSFRAIMVDLEPTVIDEVINIIFNIP